MSSEWKSYKARVDCLNVALKVSWNEVAAKKGIVGEQRARLDAAGSRMTELRNCRDEARVSTATCRKELLPVQQNLAMAPEKVRAVQFVLLRWKKSGALYQLNKRSRA